MDDLALIMQELEKLKKESVDILSQIDNNSLNDSNYKKTKDTQVDKSANSSFISNRESQQSEISNVSTSPKLVKEVRDYKEIEKYFIKIEERIRDLQSQLIKIESSKLQFEKALIKSIKYLAEKVENNNCSEIKKHLEILVEEIKKISELDLSNAKLLNKVLDIKKNEDDIIMGEIKYLKKILLQLIELNKKYFLQIQNNKNLIERVDKIEKIIGLITEDLEKMKNI